MFSLDIYGDTPSFAWSPDGQFLAFAAANYEDFLEGYEPAAEEAGVYVYRRAENDVEQVRDRAGYLPWWTDDGELSVCLGGRYGNCEEHGTIQVPLLVGRWFGPTPGLPGIQLKTKARCHMPMALHRALA